MTKCQFPRLVFPFVFDDKAAYDAESRGYQADVVVELADGSTFKLVFYDLCRLRQDLEEEEKAGNPFVADPGMVVLARVTSGNMTKAVDRLFKEGFFSHLVCEKTNK